MKRQSNKEWAANAQAKILSSVEEFNRSGPGGMKCAIGIKDTREKHYQFSGELELVQGEESYSHPFKCIRSFKSAEEDVFEVAAIFRDDFRLPTKEQDIFDLIELAQPANIVLTGGGTDPMHVMGVAVSIPLFALSGRFLAYAITVVNEAEERTNGGPHETEEATQKQKGLRSEGPAASPC
jgi:hypothetical protein